MTVLLDTFVTPGSSGPSPANGSVNYPYSTATTGEDGIDALTTLAGTPTDGMYGITGAGTSSETLWRYSTTATTWVPPVVYAGTIAGAKIIVGDDASPDGWTDSSSGGGTVTTDGTVLTLECASTSDQAVLVYTDTGMSSAGNWYMRCRIRTTAITAAGGSAAIRVEDGTNGFIFGTRRAAGLTTSLGRHWNDTTGTDIAAQVAGDGDLTTAEVQIECYKIGAMLQFRINAGRWRACAGSSAAASAAKDIYVFTSGNGGSGAMTMTVRDWYSMRY